jgi:hypothetical protein
MSRRLAALATLLAAVALPLFVTAPRAGGRQAPPAKLPSLDPILGAGADQAWKATGAYTVAPDDKLGRPVLTAGPAPLALETKAPAAGAREVRVLVRLRGDASAALSLAHKDKPDQSVRLAVSTTRTADAITCHALHAGKALHDVAALAKTLDWQPQVADGLTYHPRAYGFKDIRPGWPEDFRVRIEHDMAALPGPQEKWLSLRVELRDGEVRFWVDDRLVGRKSAAEVRADGRTRIDLSPGAQLAGYSETPWAATKGFLPLRLEDYANGRAFLDGAAVKPGALPAGSPATVGGVPFHFPAVTAEGMDHLDLSKSLYRQANLEGYMPSSGHRWIGASHRDPARFQLRIPNGTYDTLYLVAAFDGEKERIPLVTAMFYRPSAGFAESFEANVPLATAQGAGVQAVPVTLTDGRAANLWLVKIPLDPGRLSSFADMDHVEVELTKKVYQFRSYPDPFIYGYHQGGTPSGVHVYAATLGETPVAFTLNPGKFGHVWTAPEVPGYTATVADRAGAGGAGTLTVVTRSYDGTETAKQEHPVRLAAGGTQPMKLSLPVKLNGYHEVTATLDFGGKKWQEKRSFVRLAPDTRSPRWTEGKGALFGYWSYHGGHHTPNAEHHIALMTAAGARTSIGASHPNNPWVRKHWGPVSAGAWEVSPQEWAKQDPPDPKKYADYQKAVIEAFTKARAAVPAELRPDHVYFFPEPHVSQRLTEGNYAAYWNAPEPPLTAEEKERLRMFFVTAKCAAEAVRKTWPELKILIPWGDALFAVPLLRAGFPRNLTDGSGIDTPGFERLPEMQLHQIAVHRLYELRQEFAKAGNSQPRLQYCEGIFVPTEPGAVSWREQMDLYNRWVLTSMAYGVNRFYSGWFAFDCGNYYGSEHYGGCGIQRRVPYCDPKPAYAAYATMTDRLNEANFDGWLPTGSLTTYCLRFAGPRGKVFTLWTLRGKRPVTLTLAADADVQVTDAMNNTRTLKSAGRQVTVPTDPSVVYVSAGAEVLSASAGEPDHGDARPAEGARPVADLGDGTWAYTGQRDLVYEKGTFAVQRFPGKFTASVVDAPPGCRVLRSTLEKQDAAHELMPWYNVLAPKKPVVLDGAPSALGLWVKGASDWGRVIYVLRDAKGERWTSIGTQDEYNCDDVHSWSAFNFDGWRYVRFELPGHAGSDNFRKYGTTWWRSDGGDGVVDLPLTLERIIVEQRTHVLHVNDVQKVASDAVCFGKLYAEYDRPEDATEEAVRLSRLRLPLPAGAAALPNPVAELARDGVGAPTAITKLVPPLEHNDGTSVHVQFREVPGAKGYSVWVSAHADGRGAVNMTPQGAANNVLVTGLRPALKLYFWVTYQDAQGKPSKQSPPAEAVLVDTFKEK